jgi:hypothetical protein
MSSPQVPESVGHMGGSVDIGEGASKGMEAGLV